MTHPEMNLRRGFFFKTRFWTLIHADERWFLLFLSVNQRPSASQIRFRDNHDKLLKGANLFFGFHLAHRNP